MALGEQPNTMCLLQEGQKEHLFDLTLSVCRECGLVFIAKPGQREDFYDYVQMPTSKFPAEHIDEEIEEMARLYLDSSSDLILEIASNDGYFLNVLKERGFTNLHGIEPAAEPARQAVESGLTIRNVYFSREEAESFVEEYGRPKLIIARHVLEHIEDLDSFTEGLAVLMDEDSTLFLEVPDFGSVNERGDFSSIWEQHVNYFDVESLGYLLSRFGIKLDTWRTVPFSGGSLITTSRLDHGVCLDKTSNPQRHTARVELAGRMKTRIREVHALLGGLKAQGKRIAGFGAGARCSGFLNFADVAQYIDYIIDEDTRKHGLLMPKSRLGIFSPDQLEKDPVDYCIILPFNSKLMEAKVMRKYQAFVDGGGKFIETWKEEEGGSLTTARVLP
ncbi:MAG: methyltransferase domain-containing protein [Desulfovibrionaceae bacterium]|nr:methyltransferase domain-containing protein [Desulfovibrionaceae bacterium]